MIKLYRIIVIILFLAFFMALAIAEEAAPEQTVKNEQAYFTANLQKQPQEGKQKQGISNHFTFFTVNVQINGKIKDEVQNERE